MPVQIDSCLSEKTVSRHQRMNDNPARGSNDAPRGFYLPTLTFFPLPGRYYKLSVLLMCFVVPTFVPCYVWGESLWVAYFVPAVLRYTLVLNATWLVNSAAHMWGNRPYDNTINPRENKYVAFGAIGEFLLTSLIPCKYVFKKFTPLHPRKEQSLGTWLDSWTCRSFKRISIVSASNALNSQCCVFQTIRRT